MMLYGTFYSDHFFSFHFAREQYGKSYALIAHTSKNVAADKQSEHNANAEN